MTSTPPPGFSCTSYTFDPRPTYPLVSTAKRYWKADSPYLNDPEALTLVFTHGTGFLKELWEPVLEDLEGIVRRSGKEGAGGRENTTTTKTSVKIREIWTLDAPNHGDAAVLNEGALGPGSGFEHIFPWEEYGRSIHLFLSGLGKGVDVDFRGHNIVGIGHSMGAVSLALSLGNHPKLPYRALILCEVMLMNRELHVKATSSLVGGVEKRRDVWPSKEEAYAVLKGRGAWRVWDGRVLRRFVEHGLRPLPTAEYPDKKDGVTLKCTRAQEMACYKDWLGPRRTYNSFGDIVKQVPTHLIYGAVDDYIAAEVKEDMVNNRAGGVQNLASFARVPGAGHLVPQVNPTGLAEKIYDALVIASSSGAPSSSRTAKL